jgi:hypothetical protein
MAKGYEVMEMLCPQGGWILIGDDFDSITWVDDRPRCTKAEYQAGFAQYDAWKAEQDAAKAAAKATAEAKLEALGLTPADLAALGL